MKTLDEIADAVYQLAVEKGFHPEDQKADAFMEAACNNLHDEVSELHEAWRNNKLHDLCDKSDKMIDNDIIPLQNIEEEFADILIRVLDNCRQMGVDIQSAVERKHAYNKTRAFRHGGKKS